MLDYASLEFFDRPEAFDKDIDFMSKRKCYLIGMDQVLTFAFFVFSQISFIWSTFVSFLFNSLILYSISQHEHVHLLTKFYAKQFAYLLGFFMAYSYIQK